MEPKKTNGTCLAKEPEGARGADRARGGEVSERLDETRDSDNGG